MASSKINNADRPVITPGRAVLIGVPLIGLTTVVVLGAFGVPPPIPVAQQNTVYGLTFDRAWTTVVAFVALAGTITGGVALARAVRTPGRGQKGATVAIVLGPLCVAGGVVNLALADGGLGTGNGVIAGGMALVLGVAATALGAFALRRCRRAA